MARQMGMDVNDHFPNADAVMRPDNVWQPGLNYNEANVLPPNPFANGARLGVNANLMQPAVNVNYGGLIGTNANYASRPANYAIPPPPLPFGPHMNVNAEGGTAHGLRPEASSNTQSAVEHAYQVLLKFVAQNANNASNNNASQQFHNCSNNNGVLQPNEVTNNEVSQQKEVINLVVQPIRKHTYAEWVKHFSTLRETGADTSQDIYIYCFNWM